MFSRGTKTLLRNVIHHADTHNRIREEAVMWRIHRDMRPNHHGRHDSEEEQRSRRHRRSRASPLRSTCRKVPRAHMDRADSETRAPDGRSTDHYWARRLQKAEMKDPDRWGHSGFKELYPEAVGLMRSPSESSASSEPNKRKKKKKKKKKKHKKSSRHSKHGHRRSSGSERSEDEEVGPSIDLMVQQKVCHGLPQLDDDWPLTSGIAMAGVRPKNVNNRRQAVNRLRKDSLSVNNSQPPATRNYRPRIKIEPESPDNRVQVQESEQHIEPHWVASQAVRPPEPPEPHPSDLQQSDPRNLKRRDIWMCEPLPKRSRKQPTSATVHAHQSDVVNPKQGSTESRARVPSSSRSTGNMVNNVPQNKNGQVRGLTAQQKNPQQSQVLLATNRSGSHRTLQSVCKKPGHQELATGKKVKLKSSCSDPRSLNQKHRDPSSDGDEHTHLLKRRERSDEKMSSESSLSETDSDSDAQDKHKQQRRNRSNGDSDSIPSRRPKQMFSSSSSLSSLNSSDNSRERKTRSSSSSSLESDASFNRRVHSSSISSDSDYHGSYGYRQEYRRSSVSSKSDQEHFSWRYRRDHSRSRSRARSWSPLEERRRRSHSLSSQDSRRGRQHRYSQSSDSREHSPKYQNSRHARRSRSRDSRHGYDRYSSPQGRHRRRSSSYSEYEHKTHGHYHKRSRSISSLSSDSNSQGHRHPSSRRRGRDWRRNSTFRHRESSSSSERYAPSNKRRRETTYSSLSSPTSSQS